MRLIIAATLLSATVLAASGPALAADETFEPASEPSRSLLLGAGVSVQPLYEGSDDYRAAPFPIIAPSFGASEGPRRFEFRALDDIRIHALYLGRLSFGPLSGYRFGRDEDDAARLEGLGDVDGGLVVGGFVNYDFVSTDAMRFGLDVSISSQVTGDVFEDTPFALGTEFGIETGVALSLDRQITDRLRASGRAGLNFADDDFMQTAFGVTPAQAAASALPAFDPDGGLKDFYFRVAATYELTDRIELRGGAGYSRLVDDAGNSPITENANQFSGFLGAAYRFRF